MSYRIDEIEGIGPVYAEKLATANIVTAEKLLARCGSPAGRKAVAETTGLSSAIILKWANMADLMRISGIGPQFSELLTSAGVDTIKELRTRTALNLAATMADVNEQKKLCKVSPTGKMVGIWIKTARTMDPKLAY